MSDHVDMLALLEVANCPCCDGSGGRYDNYGNVEQCQWCYERSVAIAAPAAPAVQEPVAYCDERTLQTLRSGTAFSVGVEPASRRTDGNDIALYATPPAHPDAALVEALRTCEKWFMRHAPTAPLIGGFGDSEHPMLTHIRAALAGKGGE